MLSGLALRRLQPGSRRDKTDSSSVTLEIRRAFTTLARQFFSLQPAECVERLAGLFRLIGSRVDAAEQIMDTLVIRGKSHCCRQFGTCLGVETTVQVDLTKLQVNLLVVGAHLG